MGQKVMAFDDVTERLIRTDKNPATIGNNRTDCVTVSNATTSVTTVFSSALLDTNYVVTANFQNEVDTNPLFQPITITNKTTGGFTAKWNSPVDSVNYELCYTASPS